jgi:hypothetical protein
MRKLFLVLAALALVASGAIAKPALEKPVKPYQGAILASEVEPNDDAASANVLTAGDAMDAAIDVGGDWDYFAYTATAGEIVDFETAPGTAGDTKLYLYDVDGVTQIGFDDDGGTGYYSLLNYEFAADGTYYVAVCHYSGTGTGSYILTASAATPPPPPPANDTCDGAIAIGYGAFSIDADLTSATNDYTLAYGSCTGYSANGLDIVYSLDMNVGDVFNVTMTAGFDDSIYLITDCADDLGSCVAGDDQYPDGSSFTFTADAAGTYYLIVDGYTATNNGPCNISGSLDAGVDAESTSFSALKASFR